MPSQISHILHGRLAAEALPAAQKKALIDPVFRLGCQGPDLFYHNRRTRPGAFLYGTRLHQRGYGEVTALLMADARRRGWGVEHPSWSFLAGWMTHAVLDREAHPFIVAFSGWAEPSKPETRVLRQAHAFLERTLDVFVYEHVTSLPFASCQLQSGLPGVDELGTEFFDWWGRALSTVFPRLSAPEDVGVRLRHAIGDAVGFLSFTDPQRPDNARRAAEAGHVEYFHPAQLPDWDFWNASRSPWPHPVTGEPVTEDFGIIFHRAVDKARQLLSQWDNPESPWQELVGDSSLNLPDDTGVSRAPSFSKPWDYEELARLQLEHRLSPEGF